METVQYNVKWKAHEVSSAIQVGKLYSLFVQHLRKGYAFHGETHDFWEGLYVIRGEVCITADERVFTLSSGGIVFHKPLELHKFSVESEGADILIFTYSASGTLERAMENKTLKLNPFQKRIAEGFCEYIEETAKGTNAVSRESGSIRAHVLFDDNPEFVQMASLYISQLIISLSDEESSYKVQNSQSALLFSRAVDYMNSRISESISVPKIAEHINVSPSSVKRIFAKYANMGVHKYFLLLKIQAATRLLREGRAVGEVAEMLGFCSQGYFSACYKRETGKTPSDAK